MWIFHRLPTIIHPNTTLLNNIHHHNHRLWEVASIIHSSTNTPLHHHNHINTKKQLIFQLHVHKSDTNSKQYTTFHSSKQITIHGNAVIASIKQLKHAQKDRYGTHPLHQTPCSWTIIYACVPDDWHIRLIVVKSTCSNTTNIMFNKAIHLLNEDNHNFIP